MGTVVLALFANLVVTLAKLVGGLVTGSAALLSEAAHSIADTLNEIFLLASLKRSEKPADRTHPFGYGAERFFWSLLAAVGIFVSGAGFSLYQGISTLIGHSKEPSSMEFVIDYAVLAVAVVFEGASLAKAIRQIRGEADRADRRVFDYVRRSPDPTVKTVASEDTVAVIGIVVATAGTALHQVTGADAWEGVASLVIAALLAYVAYALGRDTKELLIGEAADPQVRVTAFEIIDAHPEVVAVGQLLTLQLGPDSVLLASHVEFVDTLSGKEIEAACTAIERELADAVPGLEQVFLDPSRASAEDRERLDGNLRKSRAEADSLRA